MDQAVWDRGMWGIVNYCGTCLLEDTGDPPRLYVLLEPARGKSVADRVLSPPEGYQVIEWRKTFVLVLQAAHKDTGFSWPKRPLET